MTPVFLQISSSWVKIMLHTENQLPRLYGSALKVSCVMMVVVGGFHSIMWSHQLCVGLKLDCGQKLLSAALKKDTIDFKIFYKSL